MTISFVNGQITSLAIVGSGTSQGWPTGAVGEVDAAQLTSSDGINWTADNLTLLNGPIKFRANNSWTPTTNWGGSSFSSGTGLVDGAAITSVAGIYNVTFNTSTLAYTFQLQNATNPVIGAIGSATSGGWNVDTDMSTLDGIHYSLNRVQLLPGDVKFRKDHAWTNNWGGDTFPTGVAIVDGPASTVPSAATYNVSFNLVTREYSFSFTTLALVGDATGAWPNDPQTDPIQFTTTDGVHYSLNDVVLADGYAKFRANNSWTVNWGASIFPSGTAILDNTASIHFPAGTYDITFNMTSGEYTIIPQQNAIISLIGNATAGGWESDTDMTTTDGTLYSLEVSLLSGSLKFRQNHDWAVNWSSVSFPSGIGSVDTAAIVINTPGVYNVSFNRVTGEYSFIFVQSFPVISIIGSATSGGWSNDTDMLTTDGIHYTINNVLLSENALKFRQNHNWPINWSSSSFPNGVGSVDTDAIPVTPAGIYAITFNKTSGEYTFSISTFTYFIDADADEYNNGTAILYVSSAPTGYATTTLGTDCDDSNASVYPGATEVANGYDDNCDGIIDIGTTPAAPIVSNITYCKGAIATVLTATAFPGYTLKWYTVATGGTASLIAPIVATSTAPLTKTYYVSQVLSTGQEGPRSTIVANVIALPTEVLGTITSNTAGTTAGTFIAATLAVGQYVGTSTTVSYRVPAFANTALSYFWTVPTGVNIVGQVSGVTSVTKTGLNANVLEVNFLNVASGIGAIGTIGVQAQNENGCKTAAKTIAVSKVLPAAPASVKMTDDSSSTSIAVISFAKYMGTNTVLTLTATSTLLATSYDWELPIGVTQLSGGNSNVITVNFLGVTSSNSFNYSTTTGVSTNAVRIGVKSRNGVGVSITSNTALLNPATSSTAKLLTLTAVAPAAPATVTLNAPGVTTAVTIISKYVGTSTELTLTATASILASSYEWDLPTGVNLVSPISTSRIITVNFAGVTTPSGVTSYYIGVRAKNGINYSTTNNALLLPATSSTAKLLKVTTSLPAAVSIVTGQTAGLCATSTYSYTITASPLANSYSIVAPANTVVKSATYSGNSLNTLTTNDLTFTVTYPIGFVIGTTTSSANKSIIITSVNGVGSSTAAKSLLLTTAMGAIPTVSGGTTYSSCNQTFSVVPVLGAVVYTWTVPSGASIVSGQGSASVVVNYGALAGSQTIKVITTNACGVSSAIKSVSLTSGNCSAAKLVKETVSEFKVIAYPNPSSSVFNLEIPASINGKSTEIMVYDMIGKLIEQREVQPTENVELGRNYSSGIYNIIVTQDQHVKTLRVIKK